MTFSNSDLRTININISLKLVRNAILEPYSTLGASPVAQLVENLPTMWETWVQSLGWEDSLEKGMATHSSLLAWRIPWRNPWGLKQSDTTERLSLSLFTPHLEIPKLCKWAPEIRVNKPFQ